jgi:hypothetical protein
MTTTNPGSGGTEAAASAGAGDGRAHRRLRGPARRRLHAAFTAAAALAVLAGSPASMAAGPPGQSPAARARSAAWPAWRIQGNPKTKALLARVERAYLHAAAVELSVIPRRSTFRSPRRFVLILRAGVVVAEEFTRPGRGGITLVARRSGPTYSRAAGATCWRRLPAPNPQTLTDVGIPYPSTRVEIKVLPPKQTAFGWNVMSENRGEFWFLALAQRRPAHLLDHNHLPVKRFITYAIDATSHRLRTIYIQQPSSRPQRTWPEATLRVSTPGTSPRLPAPTPAC